MTTYGIPSHLDPLDLPDGTRLWVRALNATSIFKIGGASLVQGSNWRLTEYTLEQDYDGVGMWWLEVERDDGELVVKYWESPDEVRVSHLVDKFVSPTHFPSKFDFDGRTYQKAESGYVRVTPRVGKDSSTTLPAGEAFFYTDFKSGAYLLSAEFYPEGEGVYSVEFFVGVKLAADEYGVYNEGSASSEAGQVEAWLGKFKGFFGPK